VPTGYSFPGFPTDRPYEEVVDQFEWRIPERYNIATEAVGPSERDDERMALLHTDDRGDTHRFTYGELRHAAAALQTRLREAGIGRCDRIVLCFPQSPELLVSHLAVYRLGGVAVPLSMISGTESFRYRLDHADATGAIIDVERAETFSDPLDGVDLNFVLSVELDTDYNGRHRPLGGLARHVSGDEVEVVADTAPDDPALVVYTSGTSGKPKGVVQGHQYLVGTLPGYQLWFELFGETHDERVWTPAEWAWAGALFDVVFPTLAMGGLVCSRVRRRGFDPSVALNHIASRRVSRLFLPNTALWHLEDRADVDVYDLSSLSVVMVGGEKLSAPLLRWATDALCVSVNESYGQTEANALVGNSSALFDPVPDSMGRPYPGHKCRIVDEDGTQVRPGETGEIVVRSPDPVLFLRYWDDPDTTAAAFTDDGWYRTGDLATRDENGHFYFQGRKDDLIITSGYRVSPTEVEIALAESPLVSEVAVAGVPDPERGQRIKAVVIPVDDIDGDWDQIGDRLRAHVRETLGAYKSPHEIEFLDDPPETRTGKLDRSELFAT